MRADIVPGATFPDYELPDHECVPRRLSEITPTGSLCSVSFGEGITNAEPGSVEGLVLAVHDVEASRAALVARGIDVSEVFHVAGGIFHHAGTDGEAVGSSRTTSWASALEDLRFGLAAAAALYGPAPLLAWRIEVSDRDRPEEAVAGRSPAS